MEVVNCLPAVISSVYNGSKAFGLEVERSSRELDRLQRSAQQSGIRNFHQCVVVLPWNE
jgi:hypothetical protein